MLSRVAVSASVALQYKRHEEERLSSQLAKAVACVNGVTVMFSGEGQAGRSVMARSSRWQRAEVVPYRTPKATRRHVPVSTVIKAVYCR